MQATPQALAVIQQNRAAAKFVPEHLYPGAPNEETRIRCEAAVNRFLDEALILLARDASEEEVLASARRLLDTFAEEDTEEREQADTYVGEFMRTIGIDDSVDMI
jgi:hypothetical protein